jgi:hypothetical protein
MREAKASMAATDGAYASGLGVKPGIVRKLINWWRAGKATAKSKWIRA